jgi:hypothetical protein
MPEMRTPVNGCVTKVVIARFPFSIRTPLNSCPADWCRAAACR